MMPEAAAVKIVGVAGAFPGAGRRGVLTRSGVLSPPPGAGGVFHAGQGVRTGRHEPQNEKGRKEQWNES